MKKRNKILLLGLSVLGFNLMNVNAETLYTEQKKYTLSEIENKSELYISDMFKYNDKLLISGDSEEEIDAIHELVYKDGKYTLSKVEKITKDDIAKSHGFKNRIFVDYDERTSQNHINLTYRDIYENDVNYEERISKTLDTNGETYLEDSNMPVSKYLSFYNENTKMIHFLSYTSKEDENDLIKELNADEMRKKLTDKNVDINYKDIRVRYLDAEEDPYIVITLNNVEDENDIIGVFDFSGNLLFSYKVKNLYYFELIWSNNEPKLLYTTINFEPRLEKLYVASKNQNDLLLEGKENEFISMEFNNGLIFIQIDIPSSSHENNVYRTQIYDSNMNLLKEFDGLNVFASRIEDSLKSINNYGNSNSKEIENTSFILTALNYNDIYKNYILKVEDSVKTNITGNIKDKDGNPLKDVIVELHSTPRTFTVDEFGYFKFDNVEEGKHTLTIKKADGTVLATKEINIIESTETKLDGDTLYFNTADKGLNLNIKVDGDKLRIDSIDKGTKEQQKTIKEKLEDVVVPKTFDGIIRNIIILGMLLFAGLYLLKKNSRIKVTNIK